jgi:hypothetical protein
MQIGQLDGNDVLLLTEAGRSERQWKGFVSWMLGVAGTRHVLTSGGYRWIAPISAFYPGAIQAVDLSTWNTLFPQSSIVATRKSGSTSRLFPDYLALRPKSGVGSYEWAVAEANAKRAWARRLQVRAWNRTVTVEAGLSSEAAVDARLDAYCLRTSLWIAIRMRRGLRADFLYNCTRYLFIIGDMALNQLCLQALVPARLRILCGLTA